MTPDTPPQQIRFDAPPEIFATDTAGRFHFPLTTDGGARLVTEAYDEMRFVFSIWHPSSRRTIDLDRAYVELCWTPEASDDHWIKLAEIEPVVPPHDAGETFDGWIVLPVLSLASAFALSGSGFEPRARLQIRANAYLVA